MSSTVNRLLTYAKGEFYYERPTYFFSDFQICFFLFSILLYALDLVHFEDQL